MAFSTESYSNSIEAILFFINEVQQKKLYDIVREEPKDKVLQNSIDNQPINLINMVTNENSVNLSGIKMIKNPEEDPYNDIFDNFKILVVILYLGKDKPDININI